MSLALVVAVALLLAAAWPSPGRRLARRLAILRPVLAFGAAPTLVALSLFGAHDRFGDFKISAEEVALGRQALLRGGDFSVGGGANDDIITAGLPAGLVRLARDPDGRIVARGLVAGAAADQRDLAVIEVDAPKQPPRFLGATPLAAGDTICVADCGAPDAERYRLSDAGDRLEVVGRPDERLPTLWTKKVFGMRNWLYWRPQARIYPLRDFARSQALRDQIDPDPCRRRWLCVGGRPVKSFIFRDGRAQFWVMLLDSGSRLTHARQNQEATASVTITDWAADTDGALALKLWRVDVAGPQVDLSDEGATGSRLDRPRRLAISLSGGVVSARLNPAPFQAIPAAELTADDGAARLSVVGPLGGDVTGAGAVAAPGVGGDAASAVSLSLLLPTGPSARTFQALGDAEPRSLGFGTAFAVGHIDGDTGARVTLRLDRLSFPWPMLALVLVAAVALAAALRRAFDTHLPVMTLLGGLQLLLALRWLIALEGMRLDPATDWPALMRASALAYVAAPGLLAVGYEWFGHGPRALAWETPATVAILQAAALLAFPPPVSLAGFKEIALPGVCFVACASAVVASVILRRREPPAPEPPPARGRRKAVSAGAAEEPAPKPPRPLLIWLGRRWPALMLAMLLLARLAIAAAGPKERIGDFPISLVYLPVGLVGVTAMLSHSEGSSRLVDPILFGLALALVFLFVPWLGARDVGFCIFGFPLAFWVAARAVRLWRAKARTAAVLWGTPTAAIAGAFLVILSLPLFGSVQVQRQIAHGSQISNAQADSLLQRLNLVDPNWLRIQALADPLRVEAAGTELAEEHRAWSASLSDYTSGAFGYGFLHPSKLPQAIRSDQMDDDVSAVHVMGAYGRLGAAALLVLLLAQAGWGAPIGATQASVRAILGRLSLWTLFGVATYMVLDNLQLLPFTGKNVYFLASASTGDLWEGTVLYSLALLGLTERRV